MIKKAVVLAGLFLLSGCGGGSGGGSSVSDTSDADKLYGDLGAKDVEFQGMVVVQDANPQTALRSGNQMAVSGEAAKVSDEATQEVSSGENISVTVAYTAKQAYPNGLVFQLQLIEKPSGNAEGKVWQIDGGSILDVPVGPGSLEIEAFLPYDIPSGDYVLLGSVLEEVQVDPATYDIDKDLGFAKLPIKVVQASQPDMEIAAIAFFDDYLGMSQYPEFEEDDFTIDPNISGMVDVYNAGPTEREAEVELVWETNSGKSGVLFLADETDGTLGDRLKIVIPPTQEEPYVVPVNGFLSSEDYQALLEDAPDLETSSDEIPKLKITARLYDPQNATGDSEEDNAISMDLAFLLDETLDLFYEEDYATTDPGDDDVSTAAKVSAKSTLMQETLKRLVSGEALGDKWNPVWGKTSRFAIKPSFKYEAKLGMLPWPQATAEAAAGVSVVALDDFSIEVTKLEASGLLSALPVGTNTADSTKKRRYGGAVTFKFLGAKIVDEDNITSESVTTIATDQLGNSVDPKDKAATYKQKVTVSKTGTSINKSWETDQVLGSARFFVGPVPLSITGGVKGKLSIGAQFEVAGLALEAKALAPASLDGYVRGGVDAYLVSAGVNGTVNLLSLGGVGAGKFGLEAWADEGSSDLKIGIGLKSAAFIGDANAGNVDPFEESERQKSKVSAIRASVGLYANAKAPKICWSWGLPYPCGFTNKEYGFDFYKSPWVFQKHIPIFGWSKQFELFYLDADNTLHSSI